MSMLAQIGWPHRRALRDFVRQTDHVTFDAYQRHGAVRQGDRFALDHA